MKYKKGSAFPCTGCDFAGKSIATLKKHKRTEHSISFNTSKKVLKPRQSTRNNSIVEKLMVEDETVTDSTNDSVTQLEEKPQDTPLKYTCYECNFITTSKESINKHGKAKHKEFRFICTSCNHKFTEVENYDNHVKIHEIDDNEDIAELKNRIFCHILENMIDCDKPKGQGECKSGDQSECESASGESLINHKQTSPKPAEAKTTNDNRKMKCDQCIFQCYLSVQMKKHVEKKHEAKTDKSGSETVNEDNLNNHLKSSPKPEEAKTGDRKIKCDQCIYECNQNVQMQKHVDEKHEVKIDQNYKCDQCDFGGDLIIDIWSHKVEKHVGTTVDINKLDEKKMYFNFMAEQNLEVIDEITKFKDGMRQVLEQLITDFEDNMTEIRKEVIKHNQITTKAIADLKKEIVNSKSTSKEAKKTTTSKDAKKTKGQSNQSPSSVSPMPTSRAPPATESKSKSSGTTQVPINSESRKKPLTEYQKRPHVLFVGDSIAHNSNFRKLEHVTNTTIKTSKAYSSVWDDGARFKHLNVKDVVQDELCKGDVDHLVLAAPTVDISNLDTSKVKPSDSTEIFKQKVGISCQNMINVAQDALEKHSGIKNVTILNHSPRFDTRQVDPVGLKPNLANFANNYLLELWLDSPHKNNIFIGSHSLESSANVRKERYTDDRTGWYDGVHLYGSSGKTAYTESVLNILLSSLSVQDPAPANQRQMNDNYHNTCPQSKHNEKQKRKYSSVVTGQDPIKTHHRFSPLLN